MKFCHLIRNLVRYRFNFECKWFDELNTYGIKIILGNRERIIPYDNEKELEELWFAIHLLVNTKGEASVSLVKEV